MSLRFRMQLAGLMCSALMLSQCAYADTIGLGNTPTAQVFSSVSPQGGVSEVLEHCLQSVVNVSFSYTSTDMFSAAFDEHLLSDIFNAGPADAAYTRLYTSGVVIAEDGYILAHIPDVSGAGDWKVTLPDNTEQSATLVGADPVSGFALLKVNATHLISISQLPMTTKRSDWSFALGRPTPHRDAVVAGRVLSWSSDVHLSPYQTYMTTDIHDGIHSDGGLLVDTQGTPEGILIVLSHGTGDSNTLAIPLSEALSIAHQLKKQGLVTYGYLGIVVESQEGPVSSSFGRPFRPGSLSLISSEPQQARASFFWFRPGSLSLISSPEVASPQVFFGSFRPGSLSLISSPPEEVASTGTLSEKNKPAAAPVASAQPVSAQPLQRRNLRPGALSALSPGVDSQDHAAHALGVLVSSVRPGSPADKAHLMSGDMIMRINAIDIHSVYDVLRIVGQSEPGTRAVIDVQRKGVRQRLVATIGALPTVKSDMRSVHISMVDSKVSPLLGASFEPLSAQDQSHYTVKEGVRVSAVKKGSPAESMGLHVGDIIVKVNGKAISRVATLESLLAQSHSSVAVMIRNHLVTVDLS